MIETWDNIYTELHNNDMSFQIEWNYYVLENRLNDVKCKYGDKAYMDIKNEFTETYIKNKTC